MTHLDEAADLQRRFGGLECLSGIPGSAGATPVQNVGAYGAEVADTIRRVRLLELGACAGLTLLLDRYRWRGVGWVWGAAGSPLEFVVSGQAPPAGLTIVERAGCDIAPIDPNDRAAVRRLHAFIAAELTTAHAQLDTALALARSAPVRVVRASAGEWLRQRLAETPDPDVHTVVWHSQVWHLLDRAEQDDIRVMLAEAADRFPLSRVSWEPLRVGQRAALCIEDYS